MDEGLIVLVSDCACMYGLKDKLDTFSLVPDVRWVSLKRHISVMSHDVRALGSRSAAHTLPYVVHKPYNQSPESFSAAVRHQSLFNPPSVAVVISLDILDT